MVQASAVSQGSSLLLNGTLSVFIVGIPSILAYALQKNKKIISSRGFWSVEIHVVSIILYSLLQFLDVGPLYTPCWATQGFGQLLLNINIHFLIERCVMLIIHFTITQQAVQYAEEQFGKTMEGTGAPSKSHIKRASIVTNTMVMIHSMQSPTFDSKKLLEMRRKFHYGLFSYSKLFAMISAIVLSLPIFLIFAVRDELGAVDSGNPDCSAIALKIAIYECCILGFMQVVMAECWRRLAKVKENFLIKEELLALNIVMMLKFVFVVMIASDPTARTSRFVPFFAIVLAPLMEIFISQIVIVGLTYHKRFREGGSSRVPNASSIRPSLGRPSTLVIAGVRDTLLDILLDADGYHALYTFSMKEFAVENVLFWKAATSFKDRFYQVEMTDAMKSMAYQAAKKIYIEFCAHDAKLSVNISSEVRLTLKRIFQSDEDPRLNSSVFDTAISEIFELMLSDTFRRFVKSPEFATYADLKDNRQTSQGIGSTGQPHHTITKSRQDLATSLNVGAKRVAVNRIP